MTIADTSAWVAYLRGHENATTEMLDELLLQAELAITEPVAMELLAGTRGKREERDLSRTIAALPLLAVGGLETWESAAAIHRACRRAGATIRSQLDCLIAAVAIREDLPVLHAGRDFDLIAKHTPLRLLATD